MPAITAIKRNVNNPNRCSVYVDGVFQCSCNIDIATTLSLRIGLEVTDDVLSELNRLDRRIALKQKIWRFATYKPRTVAQITEKLNQLECTEEERGDVLSWLVEFKQVDDSQYAKNFVEASKEHKPLSPSEIRRRLSAKGVSKSIITDVIESTVTGKDVLDGALRVAEKKLATMMAEEKTKQRERIHRFLTTRGYSWNVVKETLTKLGLMTVLFSMCSINASLFVQAAQSTSTDSVRLSIRIVDAANNNIVSKATIRENLLEDNLRGTITAEVTHVVSDGMYQATLHENERVEISIHADGYANHKQVLTIRSLDSSVDLRLTARMYQLGSPIGAVTFERGAETLDSAWYGVLDRLGEELANQTFRVELVGWTEARSLQYDTSLTEKRLEVIRQYLKQKGVSVERIRARIETLPNRPPLVLFLGEDPQCQVVSVIPLGE